MKKIKNGNMGSRITNKRMKKHRCLKRAYVLFLSLLIFITADSSMLELFEVSAAEGRKSEHAITSFSPLPAEISEQFVYVGTPLEELIFPDTLEAICSYEQEVEKNTPDDDKDREEDKITDGSDEPDGDAEKSDETEKPDETETPGGDADKPDGTEKPDGDSDKPDETEKPDGDADKPDETEKPGGDADKPDETEKPDGDADKPNGTEKPDGDADKPGGTEKPDGDANKPDGTEKPDGDADKSDGTEKPDGDTDKQDETKKPDGDADKPSVDANKPDGTEKPDGDVNKPGETDKPSVDANKPDETAKTGDASDKPDNESEKDGNTGSSVNDGETNIYNVQGAAVGEDFNKASHVLGTMSAKIRTVVLLAMADGTYAGIFSPEMPGNDDGIHMYPLLAKIADAKNSEPSGNEAWAGNKSDENKEVEIQTLTETVIIKGVTWECISGYDAETPDCYVFTPVLPGGLMIAEDVIFPDIIVIVEEAEADMELDIIERISLFGAQTDTHGKCGDSLEWEYKDGTLTISGSGSMNNFDKSGAPWAYYAESIENVEMGSGVTSIGMYAFYGCSSLGSMQIPSKVKSIGKYAFYECSALSSLALPDSVDSIGEQVFGDCSSLASVKLPEGLTEISERLFDGCYALTTVNIPSTVKSINNFAFNGCASLREAALPDGLKTIGNLAFNGCSSLEIIEIPQTVETITPYSFRNCNGAVLYYPAGLSGTLDSIQSVKAKVQYTISGDGAALELVDIPSGADSIEFPVTVGGRFVSSANWEDYPPGTITHLGDHKYDDDGVCAICGNKKDEPDPPEEPPEEPDPELPEEPPEEPDPELPEEPDPPEEPNPEPPEKPEKRKEPAPKVNEIGIDYVNEELTGFETDAYYYINGVEVRAYSSGNIEDSSGHIEIDEGWMGSSISIVKAGIEGSTIDSDEVNYVIPSRPGAPKGIGTVGESGEGKADGQLTGVDTTMDYRPAGNGAWKAITGDTESGLEPGTYEVTYRAVQSKKSFRSNPATVTIKAYEPEQNPDPEPPEKPDPEPPTQDKEPETPPDVTKFLIDYVNEYLEGFIPDTKYKINEKEVISFFDGSIDIADLIGTTITIKKAGDGSATTDSAEVYYKIPSRPKAPAVGSKNETSKDAADGQLTDVNSTMLYCLAGTDVWEEITGKTVEGLAPGIYQVICKAVPGKSFRSEPATVVIEEYELKAEDEPNARINYIDETLEGLIGGAEYSVDGDIITADADGTIKIKTEWFGKVIHIKKVGNETTTKDSNPKRLTIKRPPAPSGTGKINETEDKKGGALTGVDVTMQYRKAGTENWINITGDTVEGLPPAEYEIRYAASDSKFASESVSQFISAANMSQEPKPEAIIDFVNETLTNLKAGAAYTIDGDIVTAEDDGTIKLREEWIGSTIEIVKTGNNIYTYDSQPDKVEIPSRPAAPENVRAQKEGSQNANDGKLINLDESMQYKRDDESDWHDVTGDTPGSLAPGTYKVRIKATPASFCSKDVIRVIQGFELTPKDKPDAKIDYEEEYLTKLKADTDYIIGIASAKKGTEETIHTDADGRIKIRAQWFDAALKITEPGNNITTQNSPAQDIPIPARPAAPKDVIAFDESEAGARDGMLANLNENMEYRKEESTKWTDVYGDTVGPLAPGKYMVRIRATKADFCSESAEYIIRSLQSTPEEVYTEIDYYYECFIYLEPKGSYIINNDKGAIQADDNGEIPISSNWMKNKNVSIVKKGNGYSTSNSIAKNIYVPKRPAAPKKVQAVSQTLKDEDNGKLTGVDETMEYCVKGSGEWEQIYDNVVEGLVPATYEIRYTATDTSFASSSVTKTVYAYGAKPKDKEKDTQSGDGGDSGDSGDTDDSQTPAGGGQKPGGSASQTNDPSEGAASGAGTGKSSSSGKTSGGKASGNKSGTETEPTENKKDEGDDAQGQPLAEDGVTNVPATLKDGKIVLGSDTDIWDDADDGGQRKVFMMLDKGGVAVTVNNIDAALCKGSIADAAATANAILTSREFAQAMAGSVIEIRIDIACIDDSAPQSDIELVGKGIEECLAQSLNLNTGMYVDISVFMRIGDNNWKSVKSTNEPLEITLDIPDKMKEASNEFYTMRVHGGEYKLLNDMDDNADTITIATHLFSTYALLYRLEDAVSYVEAEYEPDGEQGGGFINAFLENGSLIWIAAILAEIIMIILIILHIQRKKKPDNEYRTEN